MFTHWVEIVRNYDNCYFEWLFHQNIFPLRESTSIMSGNGKGSHLRKYLEVHSLSSDQVFHSIRLKTFSKFSGWTFKFFFAFELYYSLYHILMIKSSYRVDRTLFNFLFNSFEIL